MITNQDRSGWFGASDTHFITGNWETKLKVDEEQFGIYMKHYHILDRLEKAIQKL